MTICTYIYQSWICGVFLFPSTLLPVRVCSQSWNSTVAFVPSLSFLSRGTLDPRLSLCSFLSISTTWSLGPSFPRAAQVSFGSILTRCPRGSWDACHVCPHPGLSTIITRWTRLNMLQKREKVNDKLRFNPGEEVLPYNFPSSNCFFFFFSEIVNYDFLKKKIIFR